MKLLEYEGKSLLDRHAVPVPTSKLIKKGDSLAEITLPGVLKSQVPTGGRGKAGGVQFVKSEDELKQLVPQIMNLPIGGFLPTALLLESVVDRERELYLSLTLDRQTSSIELIAHPEGGVDIESHALNEFYRTTITPQTIPDIVVTLTDFYDIPEQSFLLETLIEHLYDAYINEDMTLLEINPLILTKGGLLVAADAKIEVDSAALFRHQDWNFDTTPTDANFVVLDTNGTVATIANGAGLAMATVDAVANAGLKPANFLDIGGGASSESLARQFAQIADLPSVDAIIINIFGGIVQCDTVARSIVDAQSAFPDLAPLYIRLTGNNAAEASRILKANNLKNYSDLEQIIMELSS